VAEAAPSRPTLAYVYEPGSFATLALFEAARGLCDLVWVADTARPDVAEVATLLRRLGTLVDTQGLDMDQVAAAIAVHRPKGILALADDALRVTAELAAQLSLPFHSVESALALTDKHVQRQALADAGLATPKSWVVAADRPDDSVGVAVGAARFPVVLKPRVGEGSRDTRLASTPAELREAVAATLEGGARDLVVEEYIADAAAALAGDGFAGYVSVESIVAEGRVSHLAVNGRTPVSAPFRETGFFIPAALGADLERAVLDLASAAAAALGVTIGCLHTEIKLSPAGPVVIEVNGRVGGGVPEMLAAATGTHLLTIAMRLALGEPVVCDGPMPTRCVAYLLYVQAPPALRVVTAVDGVDELRALDGVEEVILRRGPGARVDWREGNHGHVLSVFGTVADHAALRAQLERIASTVRIVGS